MRRQRGRFPAAPWLVIDYTDEDAVVVAASGDIGASRSDELWSTLEEALHRALGRLVVADLTEVTSFDDSSIDALTTVAAASIRRHLALCASVRPLSRLDRELTTLLPTYPSVSAAVSTAVSTAASVAGSPVTSVPTADLVRGDRELVR